MESQIPVIGSSAAPTPIVFTDAAAHKVHELIQEEDNPDLMLRVFIAGGGCSGFQYGLMIEEGSGRDSRTGTMTGGVSMTRHEGRWKVTPRMRLDIRDDHIGELLFAPFIAAHMVTRTSTTTFP